MYFRQVLLAVFIVISFWQCTTASHVDCVIPIDAKNNYRLQWPLVFQTNGELHTPTTNADGRTQLAIAAGTDVIISCGPNYLRNQYRKEVLDAHCDGATGNFSSAEGAELKMENLTCDLRVVEEVLSDVSGCTNEKWTGTKFGYVHPKEQKTYIIGEVCYDMQQGRTLFAHVKLGDKASTILEKREKTYLTRHQHPDGRYKIEFFRSLDFGEIYARLHSETLSVSFLKLGNFIDEPALSNAQLQAVKKLSWNYFIAHDELTALDALKQDIKKLSEKLNVDVYVGSHGVHTERNLQGQPLEVYVQDANGVKRFPMPAVIWLVVQHDQKATAFGVYNDAENTVNQLQQQPALCQSKCAQITWLKQSQTLSGMVCCSYAEFKQAVKEVPMLDKVQELLA